MTFMILKIKTNIFFLTFNNNSVFSEYKAKILTSPK